MKISLAKLETWLKDIGADLDSLEKIHKTRNADRGKSKADHMFKETYTYKDMFAAPIKSSFYQAAGGLFAAAQERFHRAQRNRPIYVLILVVI